jgi:hypothetical protein
MQRERARTGLPLQVLIDCMCCSHAELVCEQIRTMYPEFRVDWIGTGVNGREDKINKKIKEKFCPKKNENGTRENIDLDILVHVGMAGEGMDSVYVSEIVHLQPANINNSNFQKDGRASRIIPNHPMGRNQTAYVNVDSSSPYSEYTGKKIMDLIDDREITPDQCSDDSQEEFDREKSDDLELPDELPGPTIMNMECIEVDEGEVNRMKQAYVAVGAVHQEDLNDPNHVIHQTAYDMYKRMRMQEAEEQNQRSIILQQREKVNETTSKVVGIITKKMKKNGNRVDSRLAGAIKKNINKKKSKFFGPITQASLEDCEKHYNYLKNLVTEINTNGIPDWVIEGYNID